MDTEHFDRATKILSTAGTRRGLVHLMAAVPVLGVLMAADDEEAKAERPVQRLGRRTEQRNRKRRNQRRRNKTQNQNTDDENGGGDGGRRGASTPCLPPTQDLQWAIDQLPAGGRLWLCAGKWQDAKPTLIISKDVTITGNSGEPSIITGYDVRQVVGVRPNIFVTFENVTIMHGAATEGAGIFNQGDLTLTDCQVTGNYATFGGGIYNQGVLRLVRGAITGNHVTLNNDSTSEDYLGGGIYNDGGTIFVSGTTIADNIAITENALNSGYGGGIYNGGGMIMLSAGSAVTNNHADGNGGGIYTDGGTVALDGGSWVSTNASALDGGGIYNDGGTVTVPSASTVTHNNPDNCAGTSIANCVG